MPGVFSAMRGRAVPGRELGEAPKPKMTVREAMTYLAASHQIRCLALMALAQGISSNLIDVRGPVLARSRDQRFM